MFNFIPRLGGSTIFWNEFKSNGILHVSPKGQKNYFKLANTSDNKQAFVNDWLLVAIDK